MNEKAIPKNAKEILYFLFNKKYNENTIKDVYIESHCAHIDELNITVGKNKTKVYIVTNIIGMLAVLFFTISHVSKAVPKANI